MDAMLEEADGADRVRVTSGLSPATGVTGR